MATALAVAAALDLCGQLSSSPLRVALAAVDVALGVAIAAGFGVLAERDADLPGTTMTLHVRLLNYGRRMATRVGESTLGRPKKCL